MGNVEEILLKQVCIFSVVNYFLEFSFEPDLKILWYVFSCRAYFVWSEIIWTRLLLLFCSTTEHFPHKCVQKNYMKKVSHKRYKINNSLEFKNSQNSEAALEFNRIPLDGELPLSISQRHQAKKWLLYETYIFAWDSCTCIKNDKTLYTNLVKFRIKLFKLQLKVLFGEHIFINSFEKHQEPHRCFLILCFIYIPGRWISVRQLRNNWTWDITLTGPSLKPSYLPCLIQISLRQHPKIPFVE